MIPKTCNPVEIKRQYSKSRIFGYLYFSFPFHIHCLSVHSFIPRDIHEMVFEYHLSTVGNVHSVIHPQKMKVHGKEWKIVKLYESMTECDSTVRHDDSRTHNFDIPFVHFNLTSCLKIETKTNNFVTNK